MNLPGALGDASGRLQFISGQHPNLDAGISEDFQSVSNIILKLILHTGHGEEFHVSFQGLDHGCNLGRSIHHG